MSERARQILLVISTLWLSWLVMMLLHEGGHVFGAICTGGKIRQIIWHPTVFSRTDVEPNPNPLIEIWAGPLIGSLAPLVAAFFVIKLRLRTAYLFLAVAGFCLLANGAYIGLSAISPVGDGRQVLAHGGQKFPMGLFGIVTVVLGLWIWNRISARFGFGKSPQPIIHLHALGVFVVAIVFTAVSFLIGNRGT